MENIIELATDRVLKARSDLVLARRFYGVLVTNVEPVITREVPTAATNGKKHFWNPDFVMSLSADELLFVQCHESEHDARHHGTRRSGRDLTKWNIAGDYAINIDLVDEKIGKPPAKALIDPKYRGMSAEDIYRSRELDEQNKPKPEESEDDESEDESDDSESSEDNNESENDESDDSGSEDKSEGSESSEDSKSEDESDGSKGSKDNESGDSETKDNGSNDDSGSEENESDGSGSGSDGEGKEGEEGEGGESSELASSGDPGGCGEVLDTAEDAGDIAEQDQKWERNVRIAATVARRVGQLPGHVSRETERANNPPQDWREVLRKWFDQGALRRETWNRPNRRFVGSGLYLPGSERDGINKAAILVDTSGSMDAVALALVRNETQAALDDGVVNEVTVIYGDTAVTRVDTYTTGDEIEFDPRGGGGTRLAPLFEHVRDNLDDTSLIVCFSDMENYHWGDEPSCPVLFAMTGYPDQVKHHLANTPWNAPGIDVGSH